MGTRYKLLIIVSCIVFLFSSYKIYTKIRTYLYYGIDNVKNDKRYGEIEQQRKTQNEAEKNLELEYSTRVPSSNSYQTLSSWTHHQEPLSQKDFQSKAHKVVLRYKDKKARRVMLTGTFFGWKERDMKKTVNGEWEYELILKDAGSYSYYFIVDGKKKIDPNNPKKRIHREKGEVSILEVR